MRHLVGRLLVALAHVRRLVLPGLAHVDGDRGVRGETVTAVVDEVLEARGASPLRHLQHEGLPVGADLDPRASGRLVDVDDAEQSPVGRGVVVERVEHRRATGADAVRVGLGPRRPAVGLALVLVLLVLLVVLLLRREGLPVVDLDRVLLLDVPDGAAHRVVEDDLAAVDPERQAGGVAAEPLVGDDLGTALDRDGAPAAGPGTEHARAEAHRCDGGAGPGGDGGDVAGPEVDAEQAVGRAHEHGVGGGSGLLELAAGRHGDRGAVEDAQHPRIGVERDDPVADRRDRVHLPGVSGEVGGPGLAERGAPWGEGRDGALVGRRHDDRAVLGDGEGGVLARLGEGVGLPVDAAHHRTAHLVVVADRPDVTGLGVDAREGAPAHADVAGARDRCGPAVLGLQPAGLDGLSAARVAVDRHDRGTVLDDVEAGLAVLARDDAVELVDGLVHPARPALGPVDDPHAAVVELGLVLLVPVGGDGVRHERGRGHGQRGTRRDARAVSTHERRPCHASPPWPTSDVPAAVTQQEGMYRVKVRTSRHGVRRRVVMGDDGRVGVDEGSRR